MRGRGRSRTAGAGVGRRGEVRPVVERRSIRTRAGGCSLAGDGGWGGSEAGGGSCPPFLDRTGRMNKAFPPSE